MPEHAQELPARRPRSGTGVGIYRIAARALAISALRMPAISSVCVRRSVASGDATFPLSDIDFDLMVTDTSGATIARVLRRYRLARLLFPRTGQCFVLTEPEIATVAELEPYRASINRRCGLAMRGDLPRWPEHPLPPLELARRVVFWLDDYFPAAVRARHRRNQRKFRLEMYNALGVLEGRWREPRVSLREVEQSYGSDEERSPFASGLDAARRALALLGIEAPKVRQVVELARVVILPTSASTWPSSARGAVATPEALALLLRTERPTLWLEHGPELAALGFQAPPRDAWLGMARRLASPLWARGPGFFEPLSAAPLRRLALAEHLAESAIHGRFAEPPPTSRHPPSPTAASFYARDYDALAERASLLRQRLARLDQLHPTPPPDRANVPLS